MSTIDSTDAARSAQMALVKGRDTKPELRVRKALHASGLRYRLHAKDLPGRPDIIFRSRKAVIFVHGCFWHQHPDPNCWRSRMPKSRKEFWEPKLTGNRDRDLRIRYQLENEGWTVLEIWECGTTNSQKLADLADSIRSLVVGTSKLERRHAKG